MHGQRFPAEGPLAGGSVVEPELFHGYVAVEIHGARFGECQQNVQVDGDGAVGDDLAKSLGQEDVGLCEGLLVSGRRQPQRVVVADVDGGDSLSACGEGGFVGRLDSDGGCG